MDSVEERLKLLPQILQLKLLSCESIETLDFTVEKKMPTSVLGQCGGNNAPAVRHRGLH